MNIIVLNIIVRHCFSLHFLFFGFSIFVVLAAQRRVSIHRSMCYRTANHMKVLFSLLIKHTFRFFFFLRFDCWNFSAFSRCKESKSFYVW